ncbi:hypothetical protein D9758_014886 [Tetrapyrgos nigripes]|uniref:F-box domain-containing protein n=1 Tax=Tetrapyrgos nigripes TaxID=182062 RepID=A0A8H5CEP4_9AGAR|nr:hypothetical protein D9758_014886 [Tetrapyrgos nigripes]
MSSLRLPLELVEEIFGHLLEVTNPRIPSSPSRSALRACALSCRAFFCPAIRYLWHNMYPLPLLKLLPGFGLDENGFYDITDGLDSNDMERFDLYSFMVKTILITENSEFQVRSTVYATLSTTRPRPLPSLTSVTCSVEHFSPRILFMVSPFLESVTFTRVDSRKLSEYLPLLAKESPMLHSLSILEAYGESDLSYIAQLPQLRLLKLTLREDLGFSTKTGRLADRGPWSLKQLDLRDYFQPLKDIIGVMGLYRNSELSSLSLICLEKPRKGWVEIFGILSSQWSHTLTDLTLNIGRVTDIDATMQTSWLNTFKPLSSLKNLQLFHLSVHGVTWENTSCEMIISDIGSRWPNLTDLKFLTDSSNNQPTLTSLTSLSSCFPQLKRASISLDPLSITHNESSSIPTSNVDHKLERITLVIRSTVDRSASLANHLDRIFPHLKDVSM